MQDVRLAEQTFKQDSNLLRSNEQQLGGNHLLNNNFGQNGATIIEKDVRIVEQSLPGAHLQGSPRLMQGSPRLMQGSPRLVQGSPRLMQGSPRLIQGSPTGLYQGSPSRQMGFNQSLGNFTGQQTTYTTTTNNAPCVQNVGFVQG